MLLIRGKKTVLRGVVINRSENLRSIAVTDTTNEQLKLEISGEKVSIPALKDVIYCETEDSVTRLRVRVHAICRLTVSGYISDEHVTDSSAGL